MNSTSRQVMVLVALCLRWISVAAQEPPTAPDRAFLQAAVADIRGDATRWTSPRAVSRAAADVSGEPTDEDASWRNATSPPDSDIRPQVSPPDSLPGSLQQARSAPIRRAVEIRQGAAKPLPANPNVISNTPSRRPEENWRSLRFVSGARNVTTGIDERLVASLPGLRARGRSSVFGFLLLNVFLSERIRAELDASGVALLGPHGSMHKVRLPLDAAALTRILDLPYVEWMGFSTAAQKMDRDLLPLSRGRTGRTAGFTGGELPLVVNLFDDDPSGAFRRRMESTGAVVGNWDSHLRAYDVAATRSQLEELIRLDFILFVEPIRPVTPSHDQSTAVMGVEWIRSLGVPGTGLRGEWVRVGVMDTGFDMRRDEDGRAPEGHLDLNKFWCGRDFTGSDGGVLADVDGHGTHVLATIAGSGAAREDRRYMGMAPLVGTSPAYRIRLAKVFDVEEDEEGKKSDLWIRKAMSWLAEPACEGPPPHVVSFSGGGEVDGGADATSRKLDAMVYEHRQLYVVAAGNTGPDPNSVHSPAIAKNALAVGNVFDCYAEHDRVPDCEAERDGAEVGDLTKSSSRGPTVDDRMKPNVVAPGTWVTSAKAGTTDAYTKPWSGTSMATPHVTGLVASMWTYEWEKYEPQATRAMLMATAIARDDRTTPNNDYGFGLANAYGTTSGGLAGFGGLTYVSGRVGSDNYAEQGFQVPEGIGRLIVVGTWDGPSASAGSNVPTAYDLDLWIERDVFCGGSPCGEYASTSNRDNVEYVIVDNPPAGQYNMKMLPVHAPVVPESLPVGMAAMMIHDTTPTLDLSVAAGRGRAYVGMEFGFQAVVESLGNYMTSGVHVARTSAPQNTEQVYAGTGTLKWGNTEPPFNLYNDDDGPRRLKFPGATGLTLGMVPAGRPSAANWIFRASAGTYSFDFKASSMNGDVREVAHPYVVGILELPAHCVGNLGVVSETRVVPDAWVPLCQVQDTRTGGFWGVGRNRWFAVRLFKEYDFTLSEETTVTIELTASDRTAVERDQAELCESFVPDLTLMTGDRTRVVEWNVGAGVDSGEESVAVIRRALGAGTYTIRTGLHEGVEGHPWRSDGCDARLTLTVPERQGDLVVQSPAVSHNTLTTGQSFTLSAEVHNRGTATAEAARLRWYRSVDSAISTADAEEGSTQVAGLGAGDTSRHAIGLTAPSPGAWWYGACVDGVAKESDTANNCSAGVGVTVSATFTDHPVTPGTTALKAVHFRELRVRIAALRAREGLPAVQWTDPALVVGRTPVKGVHLTELRVALDAVYDGVGRPRPSYTDPRVMVGATTIKAAHIMELRAAVVAVE